MSDRAADDLALFISAAEVGIGVDDFKLDFAADEFQRGVAHQCARQKACLDEDLEAVADTQNLDAGLGLRP